MSMFGSERRNWIEYRALAGVVEVDFHWCDKQVRGAYHENMMAVWETALRALQEAQLEQREYVLFTHGWSTSRRGKTTSRSQIRKLMRSKVATPLILRKKCIQHFSVFVAAVRPLANKADGRSRTVG